ncbi:protein SGT1 homolog [Homalodisca vitripennis]|uniref:protein SGT1 homolog n=1 Tax=Homalodisca vitripennis TaxID=197043 RepID=UPI001EEB45F0|nr:protein SGT1 homolog [Homalodisca vitripennis]KAG8249030.1 Suppressor of G2 allele of SKP1 [Homalodisca vitripennis]
MEEKRESESENTPTDQSCVPKSNFKYDWYQTDTHVTVNILIKNLSKDDVEINFEEKSFTLDLLKDESFSLNLFKPIAPSKCTYRITPTKVELKLKKLNEDFWSGLEAVKGPEVKETPLPLAKHNWDKFVETELKDDPAQGEAALNELFQKIYSEGSDEVKKAMNKSFLESGGTVLSTNWNEVGDKTVDIKPPDGMEWKKWDQP